MYELPERNSWLEPESGDVIGYCEECGEEIYAGEDLWEIKGDLYCGSCIRSAMTQKYEMENYFEEVC